MATTIITKYGSGAPTASDVVRGELAVDTENGRLYTETSGGAVIEIGLNPSGNVDVTGTVTADGLTVDGNGSLLTLDNGSNAASINNTNGNVTFNFDATNSGRNYLIKANSLNIFKASTGGDISFYEDTGTTAKLFWDASAESLGIGTDSPKSLLDISSNEQSIITLSGTTNNNQGELLGGIYFYNADGSTNGPNNAAKITAVAATTLGADADLIFSTIRGASEGDDATEAMRITSGGNVGIGTDSPGSLLELEATSATVFDGTSTDGQAANGTTLAIQNLSDTDDTFSQILFRNRNTSKAVSRIASLTDSTGTEMAFVVENNGSPAEVLRIGKTGNVGIGTDNPAQVLEVRVAAASSKGIRINEITGTYHDFITDSDDLIIHADSKGENNSNLIFSNGSGGEAMRIDSSGRLLINTTSATTPGNNSAYLIVESDAGSSQEGIYIRSDGGIGDPAFVVGDASNVAQLNIFGDGDVENTNGTYGTISDARVKENITDAASQWEDFKAIRIRRYNLISKPNEPHIGVIAQELEEAGIGGLVKDTRQDGMKSVKTSILYMKAIKALQEAMERIETLEAKVAQLEGAN